LLQRGVRAAPHAFRAVPLSLRACQRAHAHAQEPALYTGSSVLDRQPDQTNCCMAVAFKGAAWTDPDSIPLMVMQTLLGGWDRNNTSGKHAGACARALRL
jgi:processing peptidase subunit beta